MSLIDGDLSEVKQGDKVLCLKDGIFVSDINKGLRFASKGKEYEVTKAEVNPFSRGGTYRTFNVIDDQGYDHVFFAYNYDNAGDECFFGPVKKRFKIFG